MVGQIIHGPATIRQWEMMLDAGGRKLIAHRAGLRTYIPNWKVLYELRYIKKNKIKKLYPCQMAYWATYGVWGPLL